MRTIVWIGIVGGILLAGPSSTNAGPISHYTSCSGSWDGEGQTACEILGVPGVVYTKGLDFSPYVRDFGEPIFEVTALDEGNFLEWRGRTLWYWTGVRWLGSPSDPLQFAYWEDTKGLTIGIEDLTLPSDWDYNDYGVRLERRSNNVPEPGGIGLLAVGAILLGRRIWR